MDAPAIRTQEASPLSRLAAPERERLIALVNTWFSPSEATTILSALAGTREEAGALPRPLQRQLQQAILSEFPAGHAAVIVSRLGIARVGSDRWLTELRERTAHEDVAMLAKEIERTIGREPDTNGAPSTRSG